MNRKILKEVKRAYTDSTRQLDFHASVSVSVNDAVEIMRQSLDVEKETDEGYNEFSPALLRKLPKYCGVVLAREGSVCVYVYTTQKLTQRLANAMKADEFGLDKTIDSTNVYRFWWD